ncbi:hypothetical protein BDV96DRAFT_693483 [Lophiotrema nucula]|uniref:Uncharacterized protein n=1 Tax=Lophiotrema nucula TaxID=690887 RepID=A0A6A5YMN3_9PLEO|nr:hypothetical protein BDV96DRAFT_693483 [Lophiotrema nucula]
MERHKHQKDEFSVIVKRARRKIKEKTWIQVTGRIPTSERSAYKEAMYACNRKRWLQQGTLDIELYQLLEVFPQFWIAQALSSSITLLCLGLYVVHRELGNIIKLFPKTYYCPIKIMLIREYWQKMISLKNLNSGPINRVESRKARDTTIRPKRREGKARSDGVSNDEQPISRDLPAKIKPNRRGGMTRNEEASDNEQLASSDILTKIRQKRRKRMIRHKGASNQDQPISSDILSVLRAADY